MKRKFTEKTEVLNIRLSKELKNKLKEISKKRLYGNSASEVVRYWIELYYRK